MPVYSHTAGIGKRLAHRAFARDFSRNLILTFSTN
jgi:hypothetical protein